MSALKAKLIAQIAQTGPLTVAQYMAACLYDPQHGYYATRAAIGGTGADFLTAPEASQMFGELIGLWCVNEWDVFERPALFNLIELGPGTGALMSDAWRAVRIAPGFRDGAKLHLVEINPHLVRRQANALNKVGAEANWPAKFDEIAPATTLIVANEFFDCLPIRQFVRTLEGWRERVVGAEGDALKFGLLPHPISPTDIPPRAANASVGAVAEVAPALEGWVDRIAERLKSHAGRALILDYADGGGDTLQALKAHTKVDRLAEPGEADLTAHVDFTTLKILARASGLDVAGPVTQGDFLRSLGIEARAQALTAAHPERGERIGRELARLVDSDQMGAFKVLCLSTPTLPPPAGF